MSFTVVSPTHPGWVARDVLYVDAAPRLLRPRSPRPRPTRSARRARRAGSRHALLRLRREPRSSMSVASTWCPSTTGGPRGARRSARAQPVTRMFMVRHYPAGARRTDRRTRTSARRPGALQARELARADHVRERGIALRRPGDLLLHDNNTWRFVPVTISLRPLGRAFSDRGKFWNEDRHLLLRSRAASGSTRRRSGRCATIFGSNCLSEPAAAFRGLANNAQIRLLPILV